MVAKITIPRSIQAALNYNEKKVEKGVAICLHAENYLKEAPDMNFYQKLEGFTRNNRLNKMASTKTLHVSLNFDPSEKLADKRLVEIASMYMDEIGFGDQPFLIYKHEDAGHPHIHIVSTTIRNDGSRISTHNIGKNQSEKARKEIEKKFDLVRAENQKKLSSQFIKNVVIEKADYAQAETKKSIANVVTAVYHHYRFGSLPEFNAVLQQFNVQADRGKEDSRIFRNKGLVFRMLDSQGNKIGVPIKASDISCKPVLKNLEKKFELNNLQKQSLKQPLLSIINESLLYGCGNMTDFIAFLREKNVETLLRRNAEGRIYGITFIDKNNKAVFNGSDLGKKYSAAGLQNVLSETRSKPLELIKTGDKTSGVTTKQEIGLHSVRNKNHSIGTKQHDILDILLSAPEQSLHLPSGLLKKRRKKRKKND